MRQLLEEDDDADGSQHALNDSRGKVESNDPGPQNPKQELNEAANHDGHSKHLEAGQALNAVQHNHGQSGSRATDSERGAAHQAHDDATDNAGDQSRKGRRSRSQGDAKAQRKGHEKHNDGGGQVTPNVLKHVK